MFMASRPHDSARSHRRSITFGLFMSVTLLFLCGSVGALLLAPSAVAHAAGYTPANGNTAVTVYKNNLARTGNFGNETKLTPANVNPTSFGRVASFPTDGQTYAQPLFVPNVVTPNGTYNIVYVVTEHDSVYAFDADHTQTAPLWQVSLGASVPYNLIYNPNGLVDIKPEVGITGTPVIDPTTKTLYVVALAVENGNIVYRLHALDITTGLDKMPSMIIQASVPGNAYGSVNGVVNLLPTRANQRPALVLYAGKIYVAFGSFADAGPFHGWLLAYDATTLAQTAVFNLSPNNEGAGLWMSGDGPSIDPTTNTLYTATGNGIFNYSTGGTELGDSVVAFDISNGLKVKDYFTPFNQNCLRVIDRDIASTGVMLLPTQSGTSTPNLAIAGGKEGRIYLLDTTNLGKYNGTVTNPCDPAVQPTTTFDNVVQELGPNTVGSGLFSPPSFWQGATGSYVYTSANGDHLKAFQLTNGLLQVAPTSQSGEVFSFPGSNSVTSSNGTSNGIVWLISSSASCPLNDHCSASGGATLRAYDATNVANELYSSSTNSARDGINGYVKFTVPVVANGEVFVGTASTLEVYGLNPPAVLNTPTPTVQAPTATPFPTTPPAFNNIGITDDTNTLPGNFDGANSYSSQALVAAGLTPGQTVTVRNIPFIWPNVAAGQLDNYEVAQQVVPIKVPTGATTLGFLGSAVGGPTGGTGAFLFTDGTSQNFTITLSDWTLNAGASPPLSFNTVVATTAYRNVQAGKDPTKTYVFYTSVPLPTNGKTIQGINFPFKGSSGTIHIFALGTGIESAVPTPTPTPAPTATATPIPAPTATPTVGPTATPVPAVYNNLGVTSDTGTNSGNYDGSHSYSAQALQAIGITPGSTLTSSDGIGYIFPNVPVGQNDDYQFKGQQILVTNATGATKLGFLGSATSGPSTGDVTITFTDGTTMIFHLTFSDWTLNGGSATPVAGTVIAATTAYRHANTGSQLTKTYLFSTSATLPSGKTVASVTLPTVVSQGTLHIFAVGTDVGVVSPTPTPLPSTPTPTPLPVNTPTPTPLPVSTSTSTPLPGSTPTPTPLPVNTPTPTPLPVNTPTPTVVPPTPTPTGTPIATPPFNNRGSSDDSATGTGNFDGVNSYSIQALQAAGLIQGNIVTVNGINFVWPAAQAGSNNNYIVRGQVLPVTPVPGATVLGLLGSATSGPSIGTAQITYTDGTKQPFTITFSDWTLNGGGGKAIGKTVATLPYRNTPAGKQVTSTYIFYVDVALQSGKTVATVTMPSTVSQGWLHVFAVGTGTGTALTNVPTPTPSPAAVYNNIGTSDDTQPGAGNFDGANSYSAQALAAAGVQPGQPFTFNGVTFTWPNAAAGTPNNYAANGQVIPLSPVNGATAVGILGSATNGPSHGTAQITYSDGTVQNVTLALNDWTLNAGSAALTDGNLIAVSTLHRNSTLGADTQSVYILYTELPLLPGKVATSLTLPVGTDQGTLHVFAVSTVHAPAQSDAFNNIGVTNDAATGAGNFDGMKSYSLQALAAAGVTPGGQFQVNGIGFTWPSAAAGTQNNYTAAGQVIVPTVVANAAKLAFIGAATNGPSTGQGTVVYTDGTTQAFTLSFSDWTLNSGTSTILANNTSAFTMPYRNGPAGKETIATSLFYTDIALQTTKTVRYIVLPATVNQGVLHVFTVAMK